MTKIQCIDGNDSQSICIIPARAGSKRIKNKNIRMFRGRPMIEWSIKAARSSGCFSRIVVSLIHRKFHQLLWIWVPKFLCPTCSFV